ncbi:ComEC/Rec2 family competence protein [Verrucomicrobium sp. 3C]|uniref:ComEC/Rec2 family competence protein n=1 Tax=Verrucomicrobium sp. 3C TaxID=1134055 RepID=UPI0004784F0F|nr:ComEC/Rec2 family competence protein [Verrucomicrobium sp. 3C]
MRTNETGVSGRQADPTPQRNGVRAPLLIPAWIFAAGCSWGSGSPTLFWPSVATVALLGALWLRAPSAQRSLLPFLGVLFFFGVSAASFHRGWRPTDDLRHLPQTKLGAECWWEGTLQSVPVEKERTGDQITTAIFAIRRASISGSSRSASGRVLLEVRSTPPGSLVLSQRLLVRGALQRPGEQRNPGNPDWREILAVRRVAYRLKVPWSDIHPLNAGNWLGRQIGMARRWASRLLQTGIENDREAVALLLGMIYGQTGGLPAKTEEEFRLAGAYHVFAVSGQNVGAFLAVGLALLEAGRISRWRWGWALLPAVAFYALFSGGSASVGRAALLSSLVLAAWLIRRPVSLLNLWGACLLLFLAHDPLSVQDVSLQLSFGVVLALLLLSTPLSRWMSSPFAPDPFIPRSLLPGAARFRETVGGGCAFLLGSSLAASMGALPFEIVHFHFVSLVGPLANLLIVPLAELIVTVGTLSLCFGTLSSLLGSLLNNANWLFVHGLLATVAMAAQLPAPCSPKRRASTSSFRQSLWAPLPSAVATKGAPDQSVRKGSPLEETRSNPALLRVELDGRDDSKRAGELVVRRAHSLGSGRRFRAHGAILSGERP